MIPLFGCVNFNIGIIEHAVSLHLVQVPFPNTIRL
jgi:hypothetical protein